jgi:hypothetical protein
VLRGGSYAGRTAREVYRQDTGGVVALVLFSPITTAPDGAARRRVDRYEQLVDKLTAPCDAQPSCAQNGDFATNLATAAARLDASLFELPSGGVIDGGGLYLGLVLALYQLDVIPLLPGIGAQLAAGDMSILAAMAPLIDPAPPDDARDALSDVVFEVVICADEGAALTDADRAALAPTPDCGKTPSAPERGTATCGTSTPYQAASSSRPPATSPSSSSRAGSTP